MSSGAEGEGFLSRWSRRKRAARAQPAPAPNPGGATEAVGPEPPIELPPIELPPIESLGAASDYTAFLQKGVSAEIRRLALQRAWASDPVIAEFRGMAEYAWDFNAPDHGRLADTDNVARLLTQVLGGGQQAEDAPEAAEPQSAEPPAVERGPAAASSVRVTQAGPVEREALPEPEPEVAETRAAETTVVGTRRHGSAMPVFDDGRSQAS